MRGSPTTIFQARKLTLEKSSAQSFSRFPTTVPRSTFDTQPGDQGRPCQVDMFAGHNKFNGQP